MSGPRGKWGRSVHRRPRTIVALSLLALVTGCQWLHAPRSLEPIHFVSIEDGVSDTDLRTKTGEEVRWVNVRPAPVAVIFSGLVRGDLSCRRGFSRDEAERIAAIIFPDSHASLCFSKAGRMTYRVVEINRPDVELNQTATVQVVGRQD